ncbi:MAG: carbonic anhydrase [Alphaproteobacteria bacterium]
MCEETGCTRRHVLGILATGALALTARGSAWASPQTSDVTPDQAMAMLKEGNQRFVSRTMTHPNVSVARQAETVSGGQHPFATILSCSDSRVPVELLFDRGIGDLFVLRVAGNVVGEDEVSTIEYGTGHLGTPLMVVMGHTKCGAVTAVVNGAKLHGHLPHLADHIKPAADRAKAGGATGDTLVMDAIRENVREGIQLILKECDGVKAMVDAGKLKVVGAVYHLETGKVEWI